MNSFKLTKKIGIFSRVNTKGEKVLTISKCSDKFAEVCLSLAKSAGSIEPKVSMVDTFAEAKTALMKEHGIAWFNRGRKALADLEAAGRNDFSRIEIRKAA
jgi:hypothetical protein